MAVISIITEINGREVEKTIGTVFHCKGTVWLFNGDWDVYMDNRPIDDWRNGPCHKVVGPVSNAEVEASCRALKSFLEGLGHTVMSYITSDD